MFRTPVKHSPLESGQANTVSDTTCHVKLPAWTAKGLAGRGSIGGRALSADDLTPSVIARFWAKVDKTASCWLYTGYLDRNGYGQAYAGWRDGDPSATVNAHRLSYVIANGRIERGVVVMHSCDVRNCVNPAHLRVATQSENIADRVQKNRNRKESPRLRKITVEGVLEIRNSSEPSMALAQRFGVCQSHINHIRRGSRRRVA